MCGIIGIVGGNDCVSGLVEALARLEYRGYDSAGVAVLAEDRIARRRAAGKLENLRNRLVEAPLAGACGIGHTRWATHGAPNERNAHPHANETLAVVHNGIIENYKSLRETLAAEGYDFDSDTDTEVIVHLIQSHLDSGASPREAVAAALGRLRGAFALAILCAASGEIFAARRGSPLVLGEAEGRRFIGSDAIALAGLADRLIYLEEGDWAELTPDAIRIFDETGQPVTRNAQPAGAMIGQIDKGNYRHFMLKEIHEQPGVVGQTLSRFIDAAGECVHPAAIPSDMATASGVTLVACGTSYYAAMVAQYWFERIARLPVRVELASEFRYRAPVLPEGGLALFISQSGETADTLAALRYSKDLEQATAAIVNVEGSTMAREAGAILQTHAGPEIGVASTKAFTCQLAVLACLAIALGRARGAVDRAQEAAMVRALYETPALMQRVLRHDSEIAARAEWIADARDVLYLGRGVDYPLALEGALKLKEISYIHAEGYAAGEMKHGPIALIDDAVPVVVLASQTDLFEKTASNMEEVAARGGRIVLVANRAGIASHGATAEVCIEIPDVAPIAAPLLYALPVQLLAYHVAVHKGTDVDQPRNLAKSVTVE